MQRPPGSTPAPAAAATTTACVPRRFGERIPRPLPPMMIAPAPAQVPSATRAGRRRPRRRWRGPPQAVAGGQLAVAARTLAAPTPRCLFRERPAGHRRSPRAIHPAATPAAAASRPPAAATRSAGCGRARAAHRSMGRQHATGAGWRGSARVFARAQDLRAATPADQATSPGRGGVAPPENPPAPTDSRRAPGVRRHRAAAGGVPPPHEAQAAGRHASLADRAHRLAPAPVWPHRARARGLRLPGTPGRGRASRLGLCGSNHPKVIPDQNANVANMRLHR